LGVASLVLEAGGQEDEAIAGLLHDAVEDQGGLETLAEIQSRFGERVASIVMGCTDSFDTPKPPWKERKQNFINSLRDAGAEIRQVVLADKIYNARSTLRDVRREGDSAWKRFNGGKVGTLWYYDQLIHVFKQFGSTIYLEEFIGIVEELEKISSGRETG
jgi:(p)ppGpp synthase/HD superfamily hydrolase